MENGLERGEGGDGEAVVTGREVRRTRVSSDHGGRKKSMDAAYF